MIRKTLVLLAAATAVGGAQQVLAQTNASVSMQVPVTLYLEVGGSLAFNTTNITATDFATGYRQSSSDLTVQHRGNVPYVVKVNGAQTTLGFAPLSNRSDADPQKAISDVLLSANSGTYQGLTSTATNLITQSTPTGSGSATVQGRLKLDYEKTPPGTYSTTVTFTIAES